jgi:transglutaminase-like putative cysteine protease
MIGLGILVTAAWVFAFGSYFLTQKPILAGGLSQVQLKGMTEEWMGFYQGESPIGYTHEVIEPRGDEYYMTDEMVLKLNLLGQETEMRMFMKTRLNLDWSIKDTELDVNSSAMEFNARAERVGDKLKLVIHSGGQRMAREIPLSQPPYLYDETVVAEKLRQLGMRPGVKLSVPVFEPVTQAMDLVSLEVMQKEKVKLLSGEVSAYKVSDTFRGQTEFLWITDSGDVVKETHPSGFSAFKVSKDQALALLSQSQSMSLDLISALAVESNRYIDNARATKYLKARLVGPNLDGLDLNGDNQKLSGRTVEVMAPVVPAANYQLPFNGDPAIEKYLAPDWQVQSSDPAIMQKTREALAGEKDSAKAAAKLVSFVSSYVEDSMVATIPSAIEVLQQRKGACKEHTVLFTAMARSAGIPARMVAGLVYSDAYLIKGFYYHAWSEVWLADADGKNGRWVRVDPTFNQFPADATHIRLKTGNLDAMISLMQIVGQTKIEVEDFQ